MNRDLCFDFMKGFGILAVIAGHCAGMQAYSNVLILKLIYSFHMPMFFIIAGYFYKENCELLNKLKADFKRLIMPYIITSIAFLLYEILTNTNFILCKYIIIAIIWGTGESHTSAIWPTMPHIGPIWFLLALFWCRFFFNLIHIYARRPYMTVLIFAILATAADRYLINLPLGVFPGISAMTFYLIGHLIKKYKDIHSRINKCIIVICAICWVLHIFYSKIDMCICYYKYYPIDILGTTFGAILVYTISKMFPMSYINILMTKLGQVSLIILCFHTLENNIVHYESLSFAQNNWLIIFVIRAILCITLTVAWCLMVKFVNQLFLKKVSHKDYQM